MFYIYIIYSKNIDAFYIGQTIDLNKRIEVNIPVQTEPLIPDQTEPLISAKCATC